MFKRTMLFAKLFLFTYNKFMQNETYDLEASVNVYHKPLKVCCMQPVTGFYRNGCCDTSQADRGLHTVCVIITNKFLDFSKAVGNDLSSARPEYDFPGLKEGDKWCLCASRWLEAYKAGVAPKVKLLSTHIRTLDIIDLKLLEEHAIDKDDS